MRNELFSKNDILIILISLRDFRKQVNHFGNGGGVPVVNEGNQNSIPLYLLDLGPVPNPVLPPSDAPGSHFSRGIISMPVPILVKSIVGCHWSLEPCTKPRTPHTMLLFSLSMALFTARL